MFLMRINPESAAHLTVTEVLGEQLLMTGKLAHHPRRIFSQSMIAYVEEQKGFSMHCSFGKDIQ